MENLKGKKVILVGLGRLGGGIAAAEYFASHSAQLTVTDALSAEELKSSIQKLKKYKTIRYKLGAQCEGDFKGQDVAIFNPAISIHSPLVQYAKKHCKEVHNDLSYFLSEMDSRLCRNDRWKGYIGITGTRGKTTTATWIGHFLKPVVIGGNMPQNGLFKILRGLTSLTRLNLVKRPIVLELSSFQLEFMRHDLPAPHIAVITNLHQDHLNRHGTLKKYRDTKALLFKYQQKSDFLILNADNPHTKEFLKPKPQASVYHVSMKKVGYGMYRKGKNIVFAKNRKEEIVGKIPAGYSAHMQYNLLTALLVAHLYGAEWNALLRKIPTLPQVPFRQELVYKKRGLEMYNDSASTSPEGVMAAIDRFKGHKTAFIFGGTDKLLDFKPLAKAIKKYVPLKNAYFLEGSGTFKLLKELKYKKIQVYDTLDEILKETASNKKKFNKIVFTPGAASFEKFRNEFDRGKQFNRLVRKYF